MLMTVRSTVLFGSIAAVVALVGGCTPAGEKAAPAASNSASTQDVPSWCGPKPIDFGLLDGNGGNSWRLVATATGQEETAKCPPSVKGFRYADGQGNTLKAISDIKGMVAAGVDAMVVFPPDAGKAVLPALTAAYQEGVSPFPTASTPPAARPASTTTSGSATTSPTTPTTGRRGSRRTCPRAETSCSSAARPDQARAPPNTKR